MSTASHDETLRGYWTTTSISAGTADNIFAVPNVRRQLLLLLLEVMEVAVELETSITSSVADYGASRLSLSQQEPGGGRSSQCCGCWW